MIHPDISELADGQDVSKFELDVKKNIFTFFSVRYVYSPVEMQECSVYDEMQKNPLVKLFSAVVAIALACITLTLFVVCCSYCSLETRYAKLKAELRSQTREIGLPDDYEYDEDNVYMQEMERMRRENLSFKER